MAGLPPELASRLEHPASLRSSIREMHGALAQQQRNQRRSEGSVAREVAALRSDLAGVNRSLEARREALIALRDRSGQMDRLATSVADAAAPYAPAPDSAPPEPAPPEGAAPVLSFVG